MPTVLRIGPYRFFFYSMDRREPPHVHVQRDDMCAKFWLRPLALHDGGGFSRLELARIQRILKRNVESLSRSWNEFFAD